MAIIIVGKLAASFFDRLLTLYAVLGSGQPYLEKSTLQSDV